MVRRLNGTPNLLLYDFGDILTFEIFANTLPSNSLRVVFPQPFGPRIPTISF